MQNCKMATALSVRDTPGNASTLRWNCWKSPGTRPATSLNDRWAQESILALVLGISCFGCTKKALSTRYTLESGLAACRRLLLESRMQQRMRAERATQRRLSQRARATLYQQGTGCVRAASRQPRRMTRRQRLQVSLRLMRPASWLRCAKEALLWARRVCPPLPPTKLHVYSQFEWWPCVPVSTRYEPCQT